MSISDNRAIVGAILKSGVSSLGSAYVFEFDGTSWSEQARLTGFGASRFGQSVSISGDRAIIGAVFIGASIHPRMRPNVPGTLVGVLFLGMVANGGELLGLDFNLNLKKNIKFEHKQVLKP